MESDSHPSDRNGDVADEQAQAEVLYDHLRQGRAPEKGQIEKDDLRIANTLSAAALSIQPDPRFQADLQRHLSDLQVDRAIADPPASFFRRLGRPLRIAVYAGLGLVLVLVFSWALRNLLPRSPEPGAILPGTPSSVAAILPGGAVTATRAVTATLAPTPKPLSLPTDLPAPIITSPALPGVDLILEAEFPAAPADALVYSQLAYPPLTVEDARLTAARLGLEGGVYQAVGADLQPASEGPGPVYIVTDGLGRMTLITSPERFFYSPDYLHPMDGERGLPSPDEQVRLAEEFLRARSLLDFPYQIEFPENSPGTVRFRLLADGLPLRLDAPRIDVQIGAGGRVVSLDYNLPRLEERGRFPIITAEQAWDEFLAGDPSHGIESYTRSETPSHIQTWRREYTAGERVELFGYLERLQPVGGGAPLLLIDNYSLAGNTQGLAQAAGESTFMQVWGTLKAAGSGGLILNVDGWQASPFPDQSFEGQVEWRDGLAYLSLPDQELLLPEAPPDLPDGAQVQARGVVTEQPELTLQWSWLNAGLPAGGGGGGGGSFRELNLGGDASSGSAATAGGAPEAEIPGTPEAPGAGLQIGQRLEAAQGTLYVMIYEAADGNRRSEITLGLEAGVEWPDGLGLRLGGEGLAGIEAYHNLPVRVWGEITEAGDAFELPVLSVERYDPLYPGLAVQAWLGSYQPVTLEGQAVLLFTAQDGSQSVLKSTIDFDPDSTTGAPGDLIVVEGAAFPGLSFGGYPVLTDMATMPADQGQDLAAYELVASAPPVIPESQTAASRGPAMIEHIELAYHTYDVSQFPLAPDSPPVYVQPAWLFSGHYADGSSFEIWVQALSEQYLR